MGVLTQVGGSVAGFDDRGRLLTLEETPIADEVVAVAGTPVGLSVPAQASVAVVQCLANPIRFRTGEGPPTATVGLRLAVNDMIRLEGRPTMTAFQAVQEVGAGELQVQYFTQQVTVPPGQ